MQEERLEELLPRARQTERGGVQVAQEKLDDEEDKHLGHSSGWPHELWIESLGMPAVLPPSEEERDVKTAIGAARATLAREKKL